LTRYAILEVEQVPAGEDKCMSCWRSFDTIEDSSDLTERPYHPVRLEPCNHLIGSHCLTKLIGRRMTNCLQYTIPITNTSPASHWITYLLIWGDYVFSPNTWLTAVRDTIFHFKSISFANFERLHSKLRKGTLRPYEGLQLWSLYMLRPLVDTTLFVLRIIFIVITTSLMWEVPICLIPYS
jgi:hypothetical protein